MRTVPLTDCHFHIYLICQLIFTLFICKQRCSQCSAELCFVTDIEFGAEFFFQCLYDALVFGNAAGHHIFARVIFSEAGREGAYFGCDGHIQAVDDVCHFFILCHQRDHF